MVTSQGEGSQGTRSDSPTPEIGQPRCQVVNPDYPEIQCGHSEGHPPVWFSDLNDTAVYQHANDAEGCAWNLIDREERRTTDGRPTPRITGFERGVAQAIAWLRAGYEYGTGPDWRENGAEWIAERMGEWRQATPG